ncbi:hypothetical protein HELRODRAFT_175544 [Helobdella robusta]|uniref:Major facilitator superfamily (MFS) profile domain-containing protein n=1 Tax=Helobdella robusta TaxID=6412 RepID=T1F9D3_HELRO|nr:hypothetical protein HELRODRAFT_175544 [Helobdella robusta]ESO00581.1 hypothetical protein HELRODRAFT_175544 [Helobdella robusta]
MCSKFMFVEPVLFLYNLYFYGSMPLVSQFVRHLIMTNKKEYSFNQMENSNGNNNSETCPATDATNSDSTDNPAVDAEASQILLIMHLAALMPAFLVVIFFGGFSDKKGRIPVLVMPMVGATFRMIFLIASCLYGLSMTLLVLSSLLDGFFGMSSLLLMGCFAYVSDVTDVAHRSYRTVLLEASGGLGVVLSHLVGGVLKDYIGYLWTYVILLGLVTITLIYIVFFLKESVNIIDHEASLSPITYLKNAFQLFAEKSDDRIKKISTLLMMFLISLVQLGSLDVQTLFLLKFPLCLTASWVGYFNAEDYVVSNLANWMFTKLLGNLFGDLGLVNLGCVFSVAYFLFFAFSYNLLMLFLVPVAGCAHMLPIPILRAYASKIVPAEKLGLMFASLAWMQMIGIVIGLVIQNEIYAATVSQQPQVVFIFNSSLYVCIILILCVYWGTDKAFKRRAGYENIPSED